jgi:predicted small integral membrane protein
MATTRSRIPAALPLAATLLTATVALYTALVAFGNITDFGTNQQFVRHVLAMDTTFKDDDLMWRAVTSHAWEDAAYVAIIVWESLAALLLIAATFLWARRHPRARQLSTVGLLMLLLLFGAGFIATGGEWFAMWQSKTWNGLDAATRVVVLSGVVLLGDASAGCGPGRCRIAPLLSRPARGAVRAGGRPMPRPPAAVPPGPRRTASCAVSPGGPPSPLPRQGP